MAGSVVAALAISELSQAAETGNPTPFLLILATISVIWGRERAANGLSVLSPLAIVLMAYAVIFALVPLSDLWFHNPMVYHSDWWRGAWLAWMALLLLYGGYRSIGLLSSPVNRTVRSSWSPEVATVIALVLLAVALLSLFFELQTVGGVVRYFSRFAERRQRIQQPVSLLIRVSMAAPAFLLVAGNWLNLPTFHRRLSLLFLWLPPTLIASSFLGQRWRAVTILVALLALTHLGYRRLRGPVIAILMLTLAAGFVTAHLYRNVVGSGRTAESIVGSDFYYNYVSGHELGVFRDFVTTLEGVPGKTDFQHGRTFLSIIPGAPFPTGGYLYSTTFTPKLYAAGTSVPNTLPGELYMNFGTVGIVVGMLLFGALLGLIEWWFRRNQGRIGALLIYAYLLVPPAGVLRGDFATFAGFTALGLVPLVIGVRLAERAKPVAATAPADVTANGSIGSTAHRTTRWGERPSIEPA